MASSFRDTGFKIVRAHVRVQLEVFFAPHYGLPPQAHAPPRAALVFSAPTTSAVVVTSQLTLGATAHEAGAGRALRRTFTRPHVGSA